MGDLVRFPTGSRVVGPARGSIPGTDVFTGEKMRLGDDTSLQDNET